jgi:hypothetical protein
MTGRPPVRATWFKFYGQRYLIGGTLRAECAPDERAVWLDFLCLANAGDGRFDCAKRDALAAQLLISRELLDRAILKFVEAQRLTVKWDKKERKEVFMVVKWDYHQAPATPHRKGEHDAAESPSPDPSSSLRKTENERERERGAKIAGRNSPLKGEIAGRNSPPLEENLKDELIEEETPKGLPFKVGDKMRELRCEHNDLIRLAGNERAMRHQGENRAGILAQAARVRQRYEQVKADAK